MNDAKPPDRLVWLRTVLDEFEGPLIRYAARFTRDVESARDAVQETFLRLCRENPGELDGRVTQWLFTVCRNRAIDARRKDRRVQALKEFDPAAPNVAGADPATIVEQQDSGSRVLQLLAALPNNQQEVVRLRFQSGLSYKDIAVVTGLSVSNVGYLIHLAIAKLREQLKCIG